jgi:hypothetical protein
MRFEVLIVVNMSLWVFWVVMYLFDKNDVLGVEPTLRML